MKRPRLMSLFEREVRGQPAALERLLKLCIGPESPLKQILRLRRRARFDSVFFLGMGSSLFASYPATYFLCDAGVPAQAIDAGEYLHYLGRSARDKTLLVLVSQSGASPEVNQIAALLRTQCRPFVVITNEGTSPLTRGSAALFHLGAGRETRTSSKTYTNTVAAGLLLAACVSGSGVAACMANLVVIPSRLRELMQEWRSHIEPAARLLAEASHFDVVSRGPGMATAHQAVLVLRETAFAKGSAMTAGFLRHGQLSSLRDGGVVVVLARSGRTFELLMHLVTAAERVGGRILVLTDNPIKSNPRRLVLTLPSLPETIAPACDILLFELLGIRLAELGGLDPGGSIQKVTREQ